MPVTNQSYRYPKDEFDAVPEDAPTGVHRAPRSAWHKVVPFVVVAVVVGGIAYGGVTLASSMLDGSSASASEGSDSPTATHKATPKPTTTQATDDAATGDGTATDGSDDSATTDDAAVDRTVSVRVLNGAGIAGLAKRGADTLQADGFSKVVAADYKGAKLSDSTVYYESDKATAEHVASLLGLTTVEQANGLSAPVTVVLITDLS